MHGYVRDPHQKLQRRLTIGIVIFALIAAIIAIPLMTNEDLRYDLAMKYDLIPGQSVEKLAEGDENAMLIVLPLDNAGNTGVNPWLFHAQFIAWANPDGIELENLETGERTQLPISSVEFTAANGDGSLVLLRGPQAVTGEPKAITIHSQSMEVNVLQDANGVPEEPGDWETSIWDKNVSWCHTLSPGRRFLACFQPPDLASYAAGDWELSIQLYGDYEEFVPIFRGQGFIPWVGFAQHDTVLYFQNMFGIWRAEIPEDILEAATLSTPLATPEP